MPLVSAVRVVCTGTPWREPPVRKANIILQRLGPLLLVLLLLLLLLLSLLVLVLLVLLLLLLLLLLLCTCTQMICTELRSTALGLSAHSFYPHALSCRFLLSCRCWSV
jgi:hypothetical protein